jgi:hypothetical protein
MREGQDRLWEEVKPLREDMGEDFKPINRLIGALGARWEVMAEGGVRGGDEGLARGEVGVKVEGWVVRGEEGFAFDRPAVDRG